MSTALGEANTSHSDHKIAFLDTMIFLHFRPFYEVNWPAVIDAREVTIIIPSITISELNKHKDAHPIQKIRKRAETVIRKLYTLFEKGEQADVRPGVAIKYETAAPQIDFDAYGLDSKWADDDLLATIISLRQGNPEGQVILVTDDLNLTLKSRRYAIETLRLPEDMRLPSELDANEKRIKELEETVRELGSRLPVLRLAFDDGLNRASFRLSKVKEITDERIHQRLERLKQDYPKMPVPPLAAIDPNRANKGMTVSEIAKALAVDANGYTEEDKREYNARLDEFYSSFRNFLKETVRYCDYLSRMLSLNISLFNDGTAPGEEIDIYVHFPDGFELTSEEAEPPLEPEPPKARSLREKHQDLFTLPYRNLSALMPRRTSVDRPRSDPPNMSPPTIRRTSSYKYERSVKKLKHNQHQSLGSLYVVFDSFESANSFQIEYRINAGNLSREVENKLHVIIDKEGDSHQETSSAEDCPVSR